VNTADYAPSLELLEAVADVGAGDLKRVRDVLGVQWPGGDEEQRMELGDGAIDAPARAHLAPVEDELLWYGAKNLHDEFDISEQTEVTDIVAFRKQFLSPGKRKRTLRRALRGKVQESGPGWGLRECLDKVASGRVQTAGKPFLRAISRPHEGFRHRADPKVHQHQT